MASLGTAYVDVAGDFTTLKAQVAAQMAPLTSRFGKLGGAAAIGLGAIAVGAVAAGKALYEVGEQFDDAYDTIRVQTGATGKELERLKRDFKGVVSMVPTDFDSAADAIGYLNTRLGLSGRPLRRMAAQFLELSRITKTDLKTNMETVTRVFGDFGIKASQQPKYLDRLFRASQKTGVSVDKLADTMVQFGSPLRSLGFNFDQAAAMVGKFEKEGVNTRLVMGSLRIALGRMADKGITNAGKAFGILTDRIKGAKSPTEATRRAIELFGARAGPDMARAIIEGRFELDKLTHGIRNGGDTIRKAGRDTRDFSEAATLLLNRIKVIVEPLATSLYDNLGKATNQVATEFIQFTKKGTASRRTIDALIKIVKLFGIAWVAAMRLAWNMTRTFFTIVGGVMKAVSKVTSTTSKGVKASFGVIKNAASDVAGFVKNKFNDIISFLRSLPRRARSAGESIGRAIKNGVIDTVGGLGRLLKGIVNAAIAGVKRLVNSFIARANAAIRTINKVSPIKDIPQIPALATGTRSAAGGMALVGEQGPELVNMPRGAAVYTASQTRRILSGGPAPLPNTGPPQVRVFIGDRELTDIVRVEMGERDRVAAGAYSAGVVG